MAGVFVSAIAALFADLNISRDAVYVAEGKTPLPVRVVARRGDAVSEFGDARLWPKTTALRPA